MTDKIPYTMAILGDFNEKLNSWYANNNANIKGSKIDILTASFGFNEIINEPTHILNNSSSCIDLILKFNSNVFYPPAYEREVRHYKPANADCIQGAIANFDREKAFHNVDANKQVMLFNETVLNIRNFLPHETVTFVDRDPSWITSRIKK